MRYALIKSMLFTVALAAASANSRADAAAQPATALTRPDLEAWLDGFMPYALQSGHVAGAVVVVVKDGETLLQKGYGYADVAARKPVDPQRTLFRPGSISKLFTWTAVMQLVEAGKLDLDRDVNEYLDFKIPPREGQPVSRGIPSTVVLTDDCPVTLRNILTHTPGFEEHIRDLMVDDVERYVPLEEYLKRWTPRRIFAPGTTPAYSNHATALAGYIIERTTGKSFDDYIDQHVLAPLDMRQATFRQPLPKQLEADMSRGYEAGSGETKPYEIVVAAPAGSLAASGSDMAHFMIAHLQSGRYGSGQILRPETAQMMHTTPLTLLPSVNRMMLGFYETNYNGHRVIAHGGDSQWFHSYLHLFIDDGIGLLVMLNSLGKEGASGSIRQSLFQQFAARYLPVPPTPPAIDAKVAAEHARMLAGSYETSRRPQSSFMSIINLFGKASVTANPDGTIGVAGLTGLNGQPRKYHEIAPFVWRDPESAQLIGATVENGAVVRWSFNEVSPFTVFEPAPWWRSPAWLMPLFTVAVGAFLLTALLWPVAAIVRRRFGATLGLDGAAARAHRLSRIAAVASLGVLAIWIIDLSMMPKLDGALWLWHLLTLVVFVGSVVAMLWNAQLVCTSARRWTAKLWSVVLAVAALAFLWVGIAYHLIGFSSNY